jgi:hypothetical protein
MEAESSATTCDNMSGRNSYRDFGWEKQLEKNTYESWGAFENTRKSAA